ncbi:hypothetical protein [Planotetraspora sp. GP83]|uniref:hypothetical protein n=1 Tax=Planotetraspora sp. GP83 TaxID=3156264 RepID=UPI0035153AA9
MARLKHISGDDLYLGRTDGPMVAAGDVLRVDGDLIAELADAYVIGTADDVLVDPETGQPGFGGGARAWPKATWELIADAKQKKE